MSAFIQEKEAVVKEIKEKLDQAKSTIVVDYRGITVAEADLLRKRMREANVEYKIYKNTMARRAVQGTEYEPLLDSLKGPSAFAFGYEDGTVPAKILDKSIQEFKKMELKAGVIDGQYYDAAGVVAIAKLPSRDELIAKLLGSFNSPISSFARVVQAIADQKETGVEPVAKEEVAAPAEEVAVEAAPAEEVVEEAPAEEAAAEEPQAEEPQE